MRRFGTQGPVHPMKNYVVSRTAELADFIMRVREGRYWASLSPTSSENISLKQRSGEATDVIKQERNNLRFM